MVSDQVTDYVIGIDRRCAKMGRSKKLYFSITWIRIIR